MQQQSSQTRSSAYLAAKAKLAQMGPEELAEHRKALSEQRRQRERAAVLAMRECTVRGRIEASGIPADYRGASITRPEVRQWVDSVNAGNPSQLVLRGTNGTGKTTEACAALLELAEVMTVRFAMLDAVKRAVDGSWINRNASPDEVLAGFMRCGCLLIDDLGQSPMDEKATAMLLQIMSERIGNGLPTIYTTNYEGTALYSRLAQGGMSQANAIMDRIKMCVSVVMDGKSLRRRVRL